MPLLEQTQQALSELSASRQYEFGTHGGLQLKSGVPGTDVGEFPFNPAKHSPVDIYPFSLMEQATGVPHVRMVIPHRPLEANIVVHHDNLANDDPRIVRMKRGLAQVVMQEVEDALPGLTDRPFSYEVGGDLIEAESGLGVETLETQDDQPLTIARSVAELCAESLTFVISDFKRLPLDEAGADYSSTIAIKVNHLAEMALPPNIGIVSLGAAAEVNTNKQRELQKFNMELAQQHQSITERLKRAGIAVAQVVFDPRYSPYNFDVTEADKQTAAAVVAVEA